MDDSSPLSDPLLIALAATAANPPYSSCFTVFLISSQWLSLISLEVFESFLHLSSVFVFDIFPSAELQSDESLSFCRRHVS